MSQLEVSPAWASTALSDLVCGPCREATVRASTKVAAYLSVPEGRATAVIALLCKEAVRLPIGVVVDAAELPAAGRVVVVGKGQIASGYDTWQIVRWWDPRPRLSRQGLLAHGPELADLLESRPGWSFGLPLGEAMAVAGGLAEGNAGPALEVIGLGPGLTPAGDDVVSGALAVLALTGRLEDDNRAIVESCASTRTTALSAALVRAASRGHVIPEAAGVLLALAAGAAPGRLGSAADQLLAIGATSGHDICAGMAGALLALGSEATAKAMGGLATIPRRRR